MSTMIHFCFLEAERNDEGFRPVISKSIDELGITFEQAVKVCEELNNHKTIAAWMTSGVQRNYEKPIQDKTLEPSKESPKEC